MALEKEIVNNIMSWIRTIPNSQVRKLHGTMYATKGDPDLYGCINGRMFHLECKQPGKNPSNLQKKRLRDWEKAGAVVGVSRSVADAQEILAPLLVVQD